MNYYNFFIDDNIRFLKDIADSGTSRLFDHFYLNGLKILHDKYNTKFTLNLFYKDEDSTFTLSDFPEKYSEQWSEVSSWLKLSFHAYINHPSKPYAETGHRFEKLPHDYDLIKKEVCRFASEESFIAPVIVHFYDCDSPTDFDYLKQQGMKVFSLRECEQFKFSDEKGVYLTNVELFCEHFTPEEARQTVIKAINKGKQYINMGAHEQYFYKDFVKYNPDNFQRLELAIKTATEANYKPVYFNELFA